jgi:hypothetical protein
VFQTHTGQHPNPEWRKRLLQIQEGYAQKAQPTLPIRQQAFRVARRGVNSAKRSKVSIVPEVHTSQAHEVVISAFFPVKTADLAWSIVIYHFGGN